VAASRAPSSQWRVTLNVVEEYNRRQTFGVSPEREHRCRRRGSGGGWNDLQREDLRRRRRDSDAATPGCLPALEAVRFLPPNAWTILPSMPLPRHGVAVAVLGNKIHFVSGKITSGGAPDVSISTGSHDVFDPQ